MNLAARHRKRRLQTPAHPCYCELHRGGNKPRGEGHVIGPDRVGLWRRVGYPWVEYGPWMTAEGFDPTVEREISPTTYEVSDKPPSNWKGRRTAIAERRREERLIKQAKKNPHYPSREYRASVAGWEAGGATITDLGLVYQARRG